jgi:predicted RNA-binding Zn ribbon-like protein
MRCHAEDATIRGRSEVDNSPATSLSTRDEAQARPVSDRRVLLCRFRFITAARSCILLCRFRFITAAPSVGGEKLKVEKKDPPAPMAPWRTAGRPARPPHRIHVRLGRPVPTFDFIGGHPVHDFNNTAAWTRRGPRNDRVSGPGALVRWAGDAGLMSTKEDLKLRRFVLKHFDRARREVPEVHRLRAVIHEILIAITRDIVPPADALAEVARHRQERGVRSPPTNLLDITARIAWSAGELFASEELSRLRCCANADCGWFFLDQSSNKSRRWCRMGECGDRAKAKRYYEKNKKLCK